MTLEKDGEDQLERSCEQEVLCRMKEERNVQPTEEVRVTGFVASCTETAF